MRVTVRAAWAVVLLAFVGLFYLLQGSKSAVEQVAGLEANKRTDRVSYSGYVVLRVEPKTEGQLKKLTSKALAQASLGTADFWQEARVAGHPVDIMFNGTALPIAERYLKSLSIAYRVMVPDVQVAIDASSSKVLTSSTSFFEKYHSFEEIEAWVDETAAAAADSAVSVNVLELGKSIEGFAIKGLKIGEDGKPVIYVNCGTHAREWISPAACLYVMDKLAKGDVSDDAKRFQWHIVPVHNADGYRWTQSDRMWRKNRRHQKGWCGIGIDLNRNYGYHHSGSGFCHAEDFGGHDPWSEPETIILRDYLENLKKGGVDIKAFLDIHAYSQLWMWSWGWTKASPPQADADKMGACGIQAATAMEAKHGQTYKSGQIATTIYEVTGASTDWSYATMEDGGLGETVYSYGVELRDTGDHGFILPEELIIPSSEELFDGLVAMASCIVVQDNMADMKAAVA